MKGFRLGQLVFDTCERQSTLLSSQLPTSIPVNNCAVSRDHERLSKREVTLLSECGQFGGLNHEMTPNVTWMRVEFVHTTSYLLATDVAQLSSSFTP